MFDCPHSCTTPPGKKTLHQLKQSSLACMHTRTQTYSMHNTHKHTHVQLTLIARALLWSTTRSYQPYCYVCGLLIKYLIIDTLS